MSTVITPNMLSAADARVKQMVFETNAMIPIVSDKLFRQRTTTRAYEILNRVVGVGEAVQVPEGAIYPTKDIAQDISTTVNMKKFGFIMNVSRELIVDDLFGPMSDDVSKAGKNAMIQTKERRAVNVLNNGFTTQLAQDGLSLFNTAHILIQGGTQSNRAAVEGALDLDSLWNGRNTMKTTLGNSGLYDAIYDAKYIWVAQANERRANELVKSEWIPQSTENTANVIGSLLNLQVVSTPLLTSTTAWGLCAAPSTVLSYALEFWTREELSVNRLFDINANAELGNSVDRDVYSWRFRERYEVATPTWYGVYGNDGA